MNVPSHATRPLPWPQWAYVPGETGAVDADFETLGLAKAMVPSAFRGYVPARHPALRYGLALNDRGYFWEAQEVLEAVWAAAPQGGRERVLLRACIYITNANLRLRMQRARSAARLFGDAFGELRALNSRKAAAAGDGFVETFPVPALVALLQAKLGRSQLSKADWIALGATVRS
ncbi:DUF309 domain-containing protein [Bradyrhizobium diazoefficiens]|nr:DUF309 domain-containing protein [Bradyrhizobium diazoefficiens]MBR0812510.1 DUF309 domain-containing protein [Bradyrhizobium diazoefficiens]